MDNNQGTLSCAIWCWLIAALGGVLATVLLWVAGGWTFAQGAFMGAVVFAIAGLLLSWLMCRPLPAPGEATVGQPDDATRKAEAAREAAQARSAEAAAATAAAASAAQAAAVSAPPAPTVSGGIKPSKVLDGEQELAARKGDWKYEADAGSGSSAAPVSASSAPEPSVEPASPAAATPEPEPVTETPAPAVETPAPAVETEAPAAAAATSTPDYDKDGKFEGANEGKRPEALTAARDGKADNLKEIKGIGPKLEILCNSLGFYHFDQIAGWTEDEVAWVNANLEGFKGRVSRDNWVEQAKILAAGGKTEFSKKVDKGGVY